MATEAVYLSGSRVTGV